MLCVSVDSMLCVSADLLSILTALACASSLHAIGQAIFECAESCSPHA